MMRMVIGTIRVRRSLARSINSYSPRKGHGNARLQRHRLGNGFTKIPHYRRHVAITGIDKDPGSRPGIFRTQHRGTERRADFSHIPKVRLWPDPEIIGRLRSASGESRQLCGKRIVIG